jgi:hypothetical protein
MTPPDPAAWYTLRNVDAVDSPALVVYRDRVLENITCSKAWWKATWLRCART